MTISDAIILAMNEPRVYGFSVCCMGRTLFQLKNIDCCYLVFSNNLDKYIEMLLHDQPQFVVGIGRNNNLSQGDIVTENTDQERSNLASLKIKELINRKELNSKYVFIKIPGNTSPWILVPKIDQKILEFVKANTQVCYSRHGRKIYRTFPL